MAQHDQMVQAIRRGDPDLAAGTVQKQWQGAATRLVTVIGVVGERGTWHNSILNRVLR
jgi:hypothetical protein